MKMLLRNSICSIFAIVVGSTSTVCYVLKSCEPISAVTAYSSGDINGDSSIDVSDVVLLSRYLAGEILLNANATEAADTYANDVIDEVDTAAILARITGSIASLPYIPQ